MKDRHRVRGAGKEEDSVEEQMKILRMEKVHQITDYWKQIVQEGNGHPEHTCTCSFRAAKLQGAPREHVNPTGLVTGEGRTWHPRASEGPSLGL